MWRGDEWSAALRRERMKPVREVSRQTGKTDGLVFQPGGGCFSLVPFVELSFYRLIPQTKTEFAAREGTSALHIGGWRCDERETPTD